MFPAGPHGAKETRKPLHRGSAPAYSTFLELTYLSFFFSFLFLFLVFHVGFTSGFFLFAQWPHRLGIPNLILTPLSSFFFLQN